MKKVWLALFLLTVLAACSSGQKDVSAYIEKISEWNAEEYEIIKDYEAAYHDAAFPKEEYDEILNKAYRHYPAFIEKVGGYKPQARDLQGLHKTYMDSLNSYYELMKLEKNNQADGEKFAEQASESVTLAGQFEEKLEKLASSHGIVLEWEKFD
ncbi:hypothetical protein GKZ89_09290 [Bacillus mangrovi]|uniref:Lipoprotein n=1 Tax=Metabacillus mangrovi TaxID=1491830 RepID=A0A7X2V4X8_9BACI|nr:hypothetical protein [Metabacillus mangrovi]MTH53596.1 hypothetical protein [Metabacillus mangrovi]